MPKSIGQKLIKLHNDPKAFWFGQFIKYILRPNKFINQLMSDAEKKLELPHRYVG